MENDYEAYLVGGAVRDLLLDIDPKDYDIATNAEPDVVEQLFKNTIPTGKLYGTITVMIENKPYEVTTYRKDIKYNDDKRPEIINFSKTLKEDLSRRDFTINAMALDIKGEVIDYFDGIHHLVDKELHCVGNAEERFYEDKLRILRAFRIASKYDLRIDKSVMDAMSTDDEGMLPIDISNLSRERVREEFSKLIICDNPKHWLKELLKYGYLEQIIPEISECVGFDQMNPHHNKDVFEHILCAVENTEPNLRLRLAAFFHDIGKPICFTEDEFGGHFYGHHKESAEICRYVMKRLKYSNHDIEYISELVYWHMIRFENVRKKYSKTLLKNLGPEKIDDFFKLQIADICASKPPYNVELDVLFRLKFECERILNEKIPFSIKDLSVNGRDLIGLGFVGKEIGDTLDMLLEMVLEDETKNTYETLMEIARLSLIKF